MKQNTKFKTYIIKRLHLVSQNASSFTNHCLIIPDSAQTSFKYDSDHKSLRYIIDRVSY